MALSPRALSRSTSSALRHPAKTFHPRDERRKAVAKPIPDEHPVMRMLRFKLIELSHLYPFNIFKGKLHQSPSRGHHIPVEKNMKIYKYLLIETGRQQTLGIMQKNLDPALRYCTWHLPVHKILSNAGDSNKRHS